MSEAFSPVTCSECGTRQTAPAVKANGDRCVSKTCNKPMCRHCGCTETAACYVRQPQLLSPAPDYCSWLIPGVCTNPRCVEKAYYAITPGQVREAQVYHRANLKTPPRRMPSVEDLRAGAVTDEAGLVHVILNHLLREEEGYALSSLDVDCFDLIAGDYGDEAAPVVNEIFRRWNGIVGRQYFTCGSNLLAAA